MKFCILCGYENRIRLGSETFRGATAGKCATFNANSRPWNVATCSRFLCFLLHWGFNVANVKLWSIEMFRFLHARMTIKYSFQSYGRPLVLYENYQRPCGLSQYQNSRSMFTGSKCEQDEQQIAPLLSTHGYATNESRKLKPCVLSTSAICSFNFEEKNNVTKVSSRN